MTKNARPHQPHATSNPSIDRRTFLNATAVTAAGAAGYRLLGKASHDLTERFLPAADKPPSGKITYLSAASFIVNWNPYMNLNLPNMRAQRVVYDYLMWIDNDGNFVPGLATSLEPISSTVWEAKLRPGVKFHNGAPFTAADVKASIELASNPQSVTSSLFPGQLHVDIVDDLTAHIVTPTPFAPLKGACLCANQSGAVISHLDAAKGQSYLEQKMNGTGPFKMVSWNGQTAGLRLAANTNYWRGVPKVAEVVMSYVSLDSGRLAALQAGEADIVEQLAPADVATVKSNRALSVQAPTSTDSIMIAFRTNTAPVDNRLVRQAIAYAIDVPAIVNSIYKGYAATSQMYGQPHTLGYFKDPNFFKYDPDRSRSLLSQAGYPKGKGLPTLTMIVPVGPYPLTTEYSEFMVQNLAAVGIKVTLRTMDSIAWTAALYKPVGHMILHGWLVPTPDRNAWYTSLFKSPGLISFIKSAAIDSAIRQQEEALKPDQRARDIDEKLEPALVEECPAFPLFTYDLITGVSAKVHNLLIPHWYEFDMFPVSVDS